MGANGPPCAQPRVARRNPLTDKIKQKNRLCRMQPRFVRIKKFPAPPAVLCPCGSAGSAGGEKFAGVKKKPCRSGWTSLRYIRVCMMSSQAIRADENFL